MNIKRVYTFEEMKVFNLLGITPKEHAEAINKSPPTQKQLTEDKAKVFKLLGMRPEKADTSTARKVKGMGVPVTGILTLAQMKVFQLLGISTKDYTKANQEANPTPGHMTKEQMKVFNSLGLGPKQHAEAVQKVKRAVGR